MQWLLYVIGSVVTVAVFLLLLGVYISPKDELQSSDVIVVVSGGDTYARTQEAVTLYREGWASKILFSGAAEDPESESNAAAMRELALQEKVPANAITVEEESLNTRENAQRSSALVEALGHESVILVTSPYHQRRTYIEFRAQLDDEVAVINHPAPEEEWSRRAWWRSPFGGSITASEAPKILYALSQS